MARMPDFSEELGGIEHAAQRFGHALAEHVEHPFRRGDAAPGQPAQEPGTMAVAAAAAQPTGGTTVSLATIEDDVRADLTQGLDWLEGFVGRVKNAAPGIISTVDAVSGTTVGKLIETAAGKFLPPGIEEEFLAIAGRYFSTWGQAAAPAAAAGDGSGQPLQ